MNIQSAFVNKKKKKSIRIASHYVGWHQLFNCSKRKKYSCVNCTAHESETDRRREADTATFASYLRLYLEHHSFSISGALQSTPPYAAFAQ